MNEQILKILQEQTKQTIILSRMEVDLAHHIKRSDQHESEIKEQAKKINRIFYILIAGAAAGISEYGSTILKWLGV